MSRKPLPRVKICCIKSAAEVALAVAAGASAVGLVSAMPSGPGVIPEALIREIIAEIPPGVASFLLTSAQDVDTIIAQQHRLRPNTLQLCDRLTGGTHDDLRAALPGIKIVQVIHVQGTASVDEALAIAPAVDALLLDSGKPDLAQKELGGTGRTHDWALSREIVRRVPVPVFLAGGLRSDNIASAIRRVAPYGLDLCTGVRTGGDLDPAKLTAFMEQVHASSGK